VQDGTLPLPLTGVTVTSVPEAVMLLSKVAMLAYSAEVGGRLPPRPQVAGWPSRKPVKAVSNCGVAIAVP
jgi:hypothetical protein